MAGEQIYVGKMLNDLNAKLDANMAKMDEQISNLEKINLTVGQSVVSGNVIANDEILVNAVHSEINTVTSGVYKECARFKVFLNGKVRIKARTRGAGVSSNCTLYYSIDGGTTKIAGPNISVATYQDVFIDINVKNLDEVILYIFSNNSYGFCEANSVKLCGKIVNLAVDGYTKQV